MRSLCKSCLSLSTVYNIGKINLNFCSLVFGARSQSHTHRHQHVSLLLGNTDLETIRILRQDNQEQDICKLGNAEILLIYAVWREQEGADGKSKMVKAKSARSITMVPKHSDIPLVRIRQRTGNERGDKAVEKMQGGSRGWTEETAWVRESPAQTARRCRSENWAKRRSPATSKGPQLSHLCG